MCLDLWHKVLLSQFARWPKIQNSFCCNSTLKFFLYNVKQFGHLLAERWKSIRLGKCHDQNLLEVCSPMFYAIFKLCIFEYYVMVYVNFKFEKNVNLKFTYTIIKMYVNLKDHMQVYNKVFLLIIGYWRQLPKVDIFKLHMFWKDFSDIYIFQIIL